MKRRGRKPGRFSGAVQAPPTSLADNFREPDLSDDEDEDGLPWAPDGLSHTRGPDGLIHHDCPMERGIEPCRCGARPLAHQGDPS